MPVAPRFIEHMDGQSSCRMHHITCTIVLCSGTRPASTFECLHAMVHPCMLQCVLIQGVPCRPNAPSNNMWQINNLRRALQEAQDRDAETSTSDSASSNGASPSDPSSSEDRANSGAPSDNGASYSRNGSHASSYPTTSGPADAADQSWASVSSNGAGPYSDGLQDGYQAEADRGGNVSTAPGRGSWQTQGLFRDENSDEEKGPGPVGAGNGYIGPSPGAARSQNGAESAESASMSRSSSSTATATPTATSTAAQQSPPTSAASPASPQSSASPAADGGTQNGAATKPAGERKQLNGLQQRQSPVSQQLAWDSADQEFDDAATVMNVLRCAAPWATRVRQILHGHPSTCCACWLCLSKRQRICRRTFTFLPCLLLEWLRMF